MKQQKLPLQKTFLQAQAAANLKFTKMMPMLDGQLHGGPWLCEQDASKYYTVKKSALRSIDRQEVHRMEMRMPNNRTVTYYHLVELDRHFHGIMDASTIASIVPVLGFQNFKTFNSGVHACLSRTLPIHRNDFVFNLLPKLLEAFQRTFKDDAPSALIAMSVLKLPENHLKNRLFARQDWSVIVKEALDCCPKLVAPHVIDVGSNLESLGFRHSLSSPAKPEMQTWQKLYFNSEGRPVDVLASYEAPGGENKAWMLVPTGSLNEMESSVYTELDSIQKILSGKSINVAEFYDSMNYRLARVKMPKII